MCCAHIGCELSTSAPATLCPEAGTCRNRVPYGHPCGARSRTMWLRCWRSPQPSSLGCWSTASSRARRSYRCFSARSFWQPGLAASARVCLQSDSLILAFEYFFISPMHPMAFGVQGGLRLALFAVAALFVGQRGAETYRGVAAARARRSAGDGRRATAQRNLFGGSAAPQ